jgi:hypothetical protein
MEPRFLSDEFKNSFHTFRCAESRCKISERDRHMAKYAVGEVVIKDNSSRVVVRAIFTTEEGQLRYAVENEGALDFVEEARLSPLPKSNLQKRSTRHAAWPLHSQ